MTSLPGGLLRQLSEWDTPSISNALRQQGILRPDRGYSDGSLVQLSGAGMTGYSVTARMRAADDGADAIPVSELHRAVISASGPVIVVMQDDDSSPGVGAFLGEVNGTVLAALKVAGFITNGRVRDIGDVRRLGLAVHARGLCVARAYMRLTAINVPVEVAGVQIAPGDLLHGDQHGFLRIPAEAAADLPAIAQTIQEEERQLIDWVSSDGFSTEELLRLPRFRH